MDSQRREALLKEYGEVATSFRGLTDIRFRLLALLPIAAAAAAWAKGDGLGTSVASLALSTFGLAASIGLVVYNARNDQLYNELAGRAAAIERSIGLPDGAFASRPSAWLTIRMLGRTVHVNHGTGVALIYAASIAIWLAGVFAPLLELARVVYVAAGLPHLTVASPASWTSIVAIACAAIITMLAARSIDVQTEARRKAMRRLAANAVADVLSAGVDLRAAREDDAFIKTCAALANREASDVVRRARVLSADGASSSNWALPGQSHEELVSAIVGLLTNLPQRWVFESYLARDREGAREIQGANRG